MHVLVAVNHRNSRHGEREASRNAHGDTDICCNLDKVVEIVQIVRFVVVFLVAVGELIDAVGVGLVLDPARPAAVLASTSI